MACSRTIAELEAEKFTDRDTVRGQIG